MQCVLSNMYHVVYTVHSVQCHLWFAVHNVFPGCALSFMNTEQCIVHCVLCTVSTYASSTLYFKLNSAECSMPRPPVLRPVSRKIRRSFVRLPIQLQPLSLWSLFVCLAKMTKCPHPPRLVELTKWANFPGYGFNLHAEKACQGEKIFFHDDLFPHLVTMDVMNNGTKGIRNTSDSTSLLMVIIKLNQKYKWRGHAWFFFSWN